MKSKIQFSLSMVIFGTIGVIVRYIALPSSATALLRGLIGSLFLLAVVFFRKQKMSRDKIRRNALLLIVSGAALGANWIFLFEAYKHTTIANAALSYYFAPVFVMALSPVVLKEKLSAKKAACIGAAMAGMVLIVGSSQSGAAGYNHPLGIFYGLLAAGFYASLMLLNKFIKDLPDMETTIIQLAAASLLLIPYVFLTEGGSMFHMGMTSLLLVLLLGVVHTGGGFFLFFAGMKQLKGQSIAVLSYIDPVTSLLISVLILQEGITVPQLLGGALLLGAIFVSEKKRSMRPA